jgi:leader peptidase (prepilin peptidase)/N-methyltransferase
MIMFMEQILLCVILAVLGLIMGSFAGATAWRIRARQLVQDKASGEKIDNKEYEQLLKLTKTTTKTDRSRCLHCGHVLVWYDLIPLASWVSTKGKCRYCHKKIGWLEPLTEIGVAAVFVSSFLLWPEALMGPLQIAHFILWLIACVLLAILFIYDLKWFLLPNVVVFPLIGIGVIVAAIRILTLSDLGMALTTLAIAVVILSGLYFVLWLISKGQWIGLGDVKLGLALALLLADWQLAFIALFAANVIGCLFVIPGMLAGKVTRKTRVPFGPLLILGGIVAMLAGQFIQAWYFVSFV